MICGYHKEGLWSDSHVLSHEKDRDLRLRMNKKTEDHCVETFKKHLPPPLRAQVKVPAKISEWVPVLPFATPGQLARETSGNERVVDMFTVEALKKIRETMEAYRMKWMSPEEAFMRVHVLRLEAEARSKADVESEEAIRLVEQSRREEFAELQSAAIEANSRNIATFYQGQMDREYEQGVARGREMEREIRNLKQTEYRRRRRDAARVAQAAQAESDLIESEHPGVASDAETRYGSSNFSSPSSSEAASSEPDPSTFDARMKEVMGSSSDSDPEGLNVPLMRRVREPTPDVEVVVNPLNQLFSP